MLTIQIINFNLEGMNEQEYSNICDKLADSFTAIPGLITKFWLADAKKNCFGGVYIWENREAMENFTRTYNDFKIRFRSNVSRSNEDGNVDDVMITSSN